MTKIRHEIQDLNNQKILDEKMTTMLTSLAEIQNNIEYREKYTPERLNSELSAANDALLDLDKSLNDVITERSLLRSKIRNESTTRREIYDSLLDRLVLLENN